MNSKTRPELLILLEEVLEETCSAQGIARLEELVRSDVACLRLYQEYMQLHGNLAWDAAGRGAEMADSLSEADEFEFSTASARTDNLPHKVSRSHQRGLRRLFTQRPLSRFAVAACVGGLVLLSLIVNFGNPQLAQGPQQPVVPDSQTSEGAEQLAQQIPNVRLPQSPAPETTTEDASADTVLATAAGSSSTDFSSDVSIVSLINGQLADRWEEFGVRPSPPASDSEWLRRVHLDLAGRIPSTLEAEAFLRSQAPDKRQQLLDSLIESRDFASHFASNWTNLLVGRSRERAINRQQLFSYMERQFGENRPWSATVRDLIAAEGSADQSGPANFLLAHLNNEAVPATAITTRILLCQQLQCSQCHRHPTVESWGQEAFWELNAFFQRTVIEEEVVTDSASGRMQRVRRLKEDVTTEELEPTYYEDLAGVMKVTYPRFRGQEVQPEVGISLRTELAQLLASDSDRQLARAFVNRSWLHFFGHALTRQVDDMGPDQPVSHPELLQQLSEAFVASDYDVHRLIRWICLSDAYHLTSLPTPENALDDPEAGELPLFTRMYVKSLSPEQLFNSLMIASGVSSEELHRLGSSFSQREEWVQQFFTALENEENSELSTFDGSLPQTLMMMNGELVARATDPVQGEVLRNVLADRDKSETDRIRELSLAALARYPTKTELEAIRKVLRNQVRQRTSANVPTQVAYQEALRDVYWAYLNSSEFSINR